MSAEMPKIPEPVYIFWSADTLHIRLWTADPERAARFAADTGATATVYVPKQEVQEATRQAMERCADIAFQKAARVNSSWIATDIARDIRALIPQDPDHLAGVGNMVEAPTSGNGEGEKQ